MKWEYRVEEISFSDNLYGAYQFNIAGSDGFELVGIYKEANIWYAVFKKPEK